MGLEALRDGIWSAATGAVTQPVEGARSSGLIGFLRGVRNGLGGLLTKPVAGAAVAMAKASEGISSDVKRATYGAAAHDAHVRMRAPRRLGTGERARLLPYPRMPAAVRQARAKSLASLLATSRGSSRSRRE